jgi:hypothetical protein
MDLPYDGYQVAAFTLKVIPTGPVLVELNNDAVWRPTTVDPDNPKRFLIGIKGPGYADTPPHPEAIEVTKTHRPRINVGGVLDWDDMIYLWDPEDNH